MIILPIQPKPIKHEILSSWLTRLALSNGFFLNSFFTRILQCSPSLFSRDIDRNPPKELLLSLSQSTMYSTRSIYSMSLKAYEGCVYEHLSPSSLTKHLIPIGVYHRKRNRGGMHYCPECLEEDQAPNFRMYWRLSFFTVCPIHEVLLRDSCPCCGAYIAVHRHAVNGKKYDLPLSDLGCCSECYASLNQGPKDTIHHYVSRTYLEFLRAFIEDRITFPVPTSHWLCVFSGLWVLASCLTKSRSESLAYRIEWASGIPLTSVKNRKGVDSLSSLERCILMSSVFWLLEDWPYRLITLSKGTEFSCSVLSDYSFIPFWVDKVFKEEFYGRNYFPSDQEFLVAYDYLRRRGVYVNAGVLASLFGADVTACRKRLSKLLG
ncbi:TniQ family protein [Gilvimarinus gilvus]|uniref:TniQ family protein n=1 Tax=Gilvimarinus gilvus TaxID=3058038 RepID=UPI0034A00770